MTFADPTWLLAGIGLAVLALVGMRAFGRRRRALGVYLGGGRASRRLTGEDLTRAPWVRTALLAGAILAVAAAAAGPEWGEPPAEPSSPPPPRQVVVALDVSASMQAGDVLPTRLARAVEAARRLLEANPEDRFGLLLFAGTAYPLAPPTADHAALDYLLSGIVPTIASAHDPGTLHSVAIQGGLDLLAGAREEGGEQHLVLVGDGESGGEENEAIESVLREAAAHGVTVHAVAVGTAEGAGARMPAAPYQLGGVVVDAQRRPVVTRMREEALRRVAGPGGGVVVVAGEGGEVPALLAALDPGNRPLPPAEPPSDDDPLALAPWFAGLALLLLFVEGLSPLRGAGWRRTERAR